MGASRPHGGGITPLLAVGSTAIAGRSAIAASEAAIGFVDSKQDQFLRYLHGFMRKVQASADLTPAEKSYIECLQYVLPPFVKLPPVNGNENLVRDLDKLIEKRMRDMDAKSLGKDGPDRNKLARARGIMQDCREATGLAQRADNSADKAANKSADKAVGQAGGRASVKKGAGPKKTGAGHKKTGAGPKKTGAGPKKTGAGPKKTGAGPKKTGAGPKKTGARPAKKQRAVA